MSIQAADPNESKIFSIYYHKEERTLKTRLAKILSIVLVLFMALSVLPQAALARVIDDNGTTVLSSWFDRWWDIFFPRPDPKPSYPAQTMSYDSHNGTSVYVDAPEGALPANTALDVAPINNLSNVQAAFDAASSERGRVYAALDINFLDQSKNEVEPKAAVTVTLENDLIPMIDDFYLVHFKGGADELGSVEMEIVEDYYLSGSTVTFEADEFSVYAFVGGGSGANMLTVYFRNAADGSVINVQAIRMSQIGRTDDENNVIDPIFDPGVPDISPTQSFEGWTTDPAIAEGSTGLSVADINRYVLDNYNSESASDTLTYYAKVYDVRYVVYHDQAGAVLMTQSYHIHAGNNTESVEIDWTYVGFKGGQNFAGWIIDDNVEVMGDYPLYKDNVGTVYQNGTSYDLSTNLSLYPYLNSGNWLIFDNYIDQDEDTTTASYTSPVFYADGESTAAPATPVRVGYTFGGWYKEKAFTNRFIFGSPLNEETKVYAKWIPASTTYRIAVWQQLSTDAVDENNLNNEYAYYTPTTVDVVLTAHTGDQVSVAEAYKLLGNQNDSTSNWGEMGYYFVYNDARTNAENGASTKVKGDGSTVLNVYYDRKLITIHFWTSSSMSTHANISGSAYVPAANGEYYYYENPNPTGYYLCGTGPNASSSHPATGNNRNLSSYYWGYASSSSGYSGYSSLNGNAPATYYANTDSINAYESGYTGYVSLSSEGYYYERYRPNNYSSYSYFPLYYQYTSTSSYDTGYYPVGEGPTPTAEGTHNRVSVTNPMVGLYQAPLVGWPADPSGYHWEYDDAEDSTHYGITYRDCYDIPDNTHTTTWNIYEVSVSGTINSTIHWMCEKLDGSFEEITTNKIKTTTTQYYDHGKFLGFMALGHNLTTNSTSTSNGFVAYQKNVGITGSDFGSNGAYIFYVRRTYDFNYISNNDTVKTEQNVKYQQDISSFANYVPTNGHEGYYFDGWYADPGCTQEFDFNTTMPNNEVTIYAKWTMMRFRVVLDPTGGEEGVNPSDITFPGNQATTFRVDYGELVQASSINNAQREGYTLLGWFLDENYTIPFNFNTPITDQLEHVDMTYGSASASERQGSDPWNIDSDTNLPKTYNDADGEHDNVIGKVKIYAQWRQNPDGVVGINVRYDATAADGTEGHFAVTGNPTEWEDPNIYADKAMAFGQPASVPEDSSLQFLYWEILDKEGNVVGKAYPGQLWRVEFANAVETDVTAKAVYSNATFDAPKPDDQKSPAAAKPQKSGTRANETYVAVSAPTPGKKYLITVTEDTAALVMTPSYYSGSARPAGTVVTVSNDTITGDYNDYLFGVAYYNGYYVFGNLNRVTYLSMQTSSNYYPYYGSDSNNQNYTYWTYNTSTKTLQNRGNTARYLYYNYDNSNNYYFTTNTSGDAITFYELVEPEISGNDYYRVTELKAGDKIIIAHDALAMTNTLVSNNRRLHAVPVTHTVSGNEHITVSTADDTNVQWEVIASNTSGYYYLKNVANGMYLDLDSSGFVTLVSSQTSSTAAWKYDGSDLSTTKSSSYPYLKLSDEFVNFDTTGTANRDIRLYAASRKYNVTFMDGYNNTQIGAVQQVEEGGSAIPPEAPDHSAQGYIFNGWNKSYDNITEDTVITAQYVNVSTLSYTVTFHYMLSDGTWTDVSQTVQHGSAANPPTVPTPPEGYTFNSWDKKYNNITSNLTINAVYKQVATTKYVITLRAVYGRANTTYETHINWFANDDTTGTENSVVQRDERLTINNGYDIPTPDTFYNGTIDHKRGDTYTPTGLAWEDHIFLGWARITTTGSNVNGTAHPEFNEDNLYVKWVANESEAHGGHYVLVNAEEGIAAGTTVTQVAADEMRPYHDMYAVWATVFYVYHSGTNTVEKIVTTTKGSTTYNLAEKTSAGYLYGGYYTEYAGVSNNYDTKTSINWNENQAIWKSDNTLDLEAMCDSGVDTGTGAKKYNGSNVKWDSTKAYTAENGLAITPVAGTTYYIKEVPAAKYLRPYLHYTYYEVSSDPKPIATAWLISDVDDLNYQQSGFVIIDGNNAAQIIRSLTVQTQHGDTTETLTAARLFGARGYLSYLTVINDGRNGEDPVHMLASGNLVAQYWVTPDGLMVTGTAVRTYSNLDSTLISADTTEGSSSITVFSSGN